MLQDLMQRNFLQHMMSYFKNYSIWDSRLASLNRVWKIRIWSSLVESNKVCAVNHDFIGILEAMTNDLNLLMTDVIQVPNRKMVKAIKHSSTRHSDILKRITHRTQKNLCIRYIEADFRLFGYE